MKSNFEKLSSTPQEKRIPVLPSGVTGIIVLILMMFNGLMNPSENLFHDIATVVYCVVNSLYLGYFHFIQVPSPRLKPIHIWIFASLQVVAASIIIIILNSEMDAFLSGLMVLLCITVSIVGDRKPANLILIGITGTIFLSSLAEMASPAKLLSLLGPALISGVVNEAIHQFKVLTRRNINQLEIITEFSRQITSSIETEQVLSLLNATIPNALEADSYFFGLREGDEIKLSLLYDDGEYFNDARIKMEGTLSGWVIGNKKDLFLPDLRRDLKLAGVENIIVGQEKTSLSWMGVPINGVHVQGVIAFASYQPNAFNLNDMELMNNMAQHAALALDNTHHHAEVERQSQLDSLTAVYNHGYFLALLKKHAEEARFTKTSLSLIMLDVDYFKQYNDTYGHLAGDEILTALCKTIKKHIKKTDIVGRWGGEEFVIALPHASGKQAQKVAQRIHETMAALKIKSNGRKSIPSPTLSQGIAQFPDEADEIMKLVDLADRRLYIAKERGRNQIEPNAEHWKKVLN